MTDDVSSEKPLVVYQVTSQHWAHAEQIRWTLLYNLLVTNTILVLAWAAVFSTNPNPRTGATRATLFGLSVFGAIVSALWFFLEERANGFSNMYTKLGQQVEKSLKIDRGPFREAESHRQSLKGLTALIQTHTVLKVVPGLFV